MSLAQARERIVEELKDRLAVLAVGYPIAELGKVYEEVGELFESVACCSLLVDADVSKFQNQLIWSALSRRRYLARCAESGRLGDLYQARSRSQAIFCALAAGDRPLALEIGGLSPMQANRDGEYPDDFAYHLLIHAIAEDADDAVLGGALQRYEDALDGAAAERLAVTAALCRREQTSFEETFEALLESHLAEMVEERELNDEIPAFEPRSRLFIEGWRC